MQNHIKKRVPLQIKIPRKRLTEFCRSNHVSRLALFGSVLSENFRSDSDLDILISFLPGTKVSFMTLSRMRRELSNIFNRQVDLVPEDGLKSVIRDDVLASAQELYEARDTLSA